jgi:uncharacterized DUF497 family protein
MEFSWDESKNQENRKKHAIDFKEASEAFDDPLHISILDKRFDYFDERWITIGATRKRTILVIGHLYYLEHNGTEVVRIITARRATKKEKQQYEKIER